MASVERRSRGVSRWAACLAGLLVCLGLGAHAMAAERTADRGTPSWPFAPGRLSLGVLVGGGTSPTNDIREADLWAVFPRVGYVLAERSGFLAGSVEIVGELSYLAVSQRRTSHVVGVAPLAKYNVRTGTRLTPFVEAGAGVTYANHTVPEVGTNFNFVLQAGAGLQYAMADTWSLDFRTIFHHLSNAYTSDENPGLNAILFTLGLSFHP